MMVAILHSNGQMRTERYGDREKGCQKSAVQQKTTDDENATATSVRAGARLAKISAVYCRDHGRVRFLGVPVDPSNRYVFRFH